MTPCSHLDSTYPVRGGWATRACDLVAGHENLPDEHPEATPYHEHEGVKPLLPHQHGDIEKITADHGQTLVNACTGSGKTITGVGYMVQQGGVWLVIAPLGVLDQWREVVKTYEPDANVHTISSKNKTALADLNAARNDGGLHVFLIGWEYARLQDWRAFKHIDGTIADEVQRMAGHGSLTAKRIWRLNTTHRIGMSGTPGRNAIVGLYNALRWIFWGNQDHKTFARYPRYELYMGQEGVDDQRAFVRRHFQLIPKPHFNGVDTGFDIGPEHRTGSVVSEIPSYIQHLENETCCIHHPGGVNASMPAPEAPIVHRIPMTAKQAKLYKGLDGIAMWTTDQDGNRVPLVVVNKMVARIRRRQVALAEVTLNEYGDVIMNEGAKSSKADALVKDMPGYLEDDNVLVFTHSVPFAYMLAKRLAEVPGVRPFVWAGNVSADERAEVKATFGRPGGPNVIVATQAKIGEGTDWLQHWCSTEVWASQDEDVMLNTQALGRLRRRGQRRAVRSIWYVAADTVEERVNVKNERVKRELDRGMRVGA